jgi:hypothetical protein
MCYEGKTGVRWGWRYRVIHIGHVDNVKDFNFCFFEKLRDKATLEDSFPVD